MSIVTLNNRALKDATAVGSITGLGNLKFISRSTASSSSSVSITSGINSTYKEYIFILTNLHPASDNQHFYVNFRDGGSDFDAIKTTTFFLNYHTEAGNDAALGYQSSYDLAQSTDYQPIGLSVSNGSDSGLSGYLHLFDPSNTTFVKHFICQAQNFTPSAYFDNMHIAGYCNTTTAIDGIDFKFASGNVDSGTIDMYGVL